MYIDRADSIAMNGIYILTMRRFEYSYLKLSCNFQIYNPFSVQLGSLLSVLICRRKQRQQTYYNAPVGSE